MIDDSDVFSVIVDHDNPAVVFASACSGIYKSETGGNSFTKIQGIPFTARRTRVLKQDPTNEMSCMPEPPRACGRRPTWASSGSGSAVPRLSFNDVMVDPRDSNHVLLRHRPQRRDGLD